MKKILSLALLCGLSSAAHAKVTYADVEADMAYEDRSRPPSSKILDPVSDRELPSGNEGGNQLGTWVQLSNSYSSYISVNDAGQYSHLISADSVGQSCLKGEKGLLLSADREKKCDHGHGSSCTYGDEILAVKGYPAECR